MTVSLILPCYNPPQGWEQVICSNYAAFTARIQQPVELILVMDGDTHDNSAALQYLNSEIAGIVIVQYAENRGKGYALRRGVEAATGDVLLYTDVDFPYTQDSLCEVYQALAEHVADVAAGVKNDSYYEHVPAVRRTISKYLRWLIRVFLSMPVTDTQCGLKGFKKEVKPLFLQTTIDRYLFDLEFIRNCFRGKQFRVKAIPVALNDNVHFRSMNYRILLPEMFNFVRLLFK